jgi:hypothetical protein
VTPQPTIDLGIPKLTRLLKPSGFIAGKMLSITGPVGTWKTQLAAHFASRAMAPDSDCAWVDLESSRAIEYSERVIVVGMREVSALRNYLLRLPKVCQVVVLDGMQHAHGDRSEYACMKLYLDLMGQGRTVIATWGSSHNPPHIALKYASHLRLGVDTAGLGVKFTLRKNMFSPNLNNTFTLKRESLLKLEKL